MISKLSILVAAATDDRGEPLPPAKYSINLPPTIDELFNRGMQPWSDPMADNRDAPR